MTCWSAGSVVGTAYDVGPCDQLQTPIVTCDAVPAEKDSDSDSQCGFGCTCGLAGQACSCDAKAP